MYFSASAQSPCWMAPYNFSARVRNASSPDDEPMTGPPAANKQNSVQNPAVSKILSTLFFAAFMFIMLGLVRPQCQGKNCLGVGVIWDRIPFETPVNPAKAGMTATCNAHVSQTTPARRFAM
jgi:hypothetical protein